MPYIGAKELKASDIRRFDVTSSTSATHTLTWTPPTEQSLIVTINGIKQHEDAYSVSGTTLTLSSALVATDKLEVIGINDIGTTITPAQNSVDTDKIANNAVTSAKLANAINITSGNSLTIDSGATITNNGTATGFGGNNTPAFYAYLSTSQVPTSGVWTKVQFDNEVYDTASAYDPTTNYRFTVPSGEGGKYFISGQARLLGSYLSWGQLAIHKNGTNIAQNGGQYGTNDYRFAINLSRVLELSAGDYIEIYAFLTGTSLNVEGATGGSDFSAFFGFKLVE